MATNGLQLNYKVQYPLSDLICHSTPNLDHKFVHDSVNQLKTQAPGINIYFIDFLYDVDLLPNVVKAQLTKMKTTLWEYHRAT